MKISLAMLMLLLTMTIGGCTRNVNHHDDRRARRGVDRDHERDRNDRDRSDRDRHPNNY